MSQQNNSLACCWPQAGLLGLVVQHCLHLLSEWTLPELQGTLQAAHEQSMTSCILCMYVYRRRRIHYMYRVHSVVNSEIFTKSQTSQTIFHHSYVFTWETIRTVLSPKVIVSPLDPRILTSMKLSTPLSQL